MPELFQAVGACLVCLFLYAIWPPLILAGAGAFFLLVGLILEGRPTTKGIE